MKESLNIKNIISLTSFFLLLMPALLYAQNNSVSKINFTPNYFFKNVSLNYFDWSKTTEEKTNKKDFTYLELEAGAGWEWGEFYIFFDLENPLKKYDESSSSALRLAYKPVLDINLYKNLALHIHDYNFHSHDYYVHNFVSGFSYKIQIDSSSWVRPFIASHYQESSFYSGYNGLMAGWTFLYALSAMEQNFSLSQWHEMTFNRNEQDGYDNKNGIQGTLSFWWHPNTVLTSGLQYRYADNELGMQEYQDAFIYSIKCNF